MKNFEKSQSELKWIRDASRKNEGQEMAWDDPKESNFDEDDESSVDHWYDKYRKWECSTDAGNTLSFLITLNSRPNFPTIIRVESCEWILWGE